MRNLIRDISLRAGPTLLPSNAVLEKIMGIAILSRNFSDVLSSKKYDSRKCLWGSCLRQLPSDEITYLEFGVWEGESIRTIAALNANEASKFYGFDSFHGLPEKWHTATRTRKIGLFSVGGQVPKIDDSRVEFIKGWFQNTVPSFIDSLELGTNTSLMVHFDADLYSSTLLALMEIDRLKRPYIGVFDEFPGHEARALQSYLEVTGASAKFLGRVGPTKIYPWQVSALITPTSNYEAQFD